MAGIIINDVDAFDQDYDAGIELILPLDSFVFLKTIAAVSDLEG